MTKDEALKQALDDLILEYHMETSSFAKRVDEIFEQALAAPVQEPVATVTSESGNPDVTMSWWHEPPLPVGTKLYTTPPAQPAPVQDFYESAYQRGYLDGIGRDCPHCKDYKAMYIKVRDELAAEQQLTERQKARIVELQEHIENFDGENR
jgi:hypothetical protein